MRQGGLIDFWRRSRHIKTSAVSLLIALIVIPSANAYPPSAMIHADTGIIEDISLVDIADDAIWRAGHSSRIDILDFPGTTGDSQGYARYVCARLEDGSEKCVLQTHPCFAAHGWIEGIFEITVPNGPQGVLFMCNIGFAEGASASDGVSFSVEWVASAASTSLLSAVLSDKARLQRIISCGEGGEAPFEDKPVPLPLFQGCLLKRLAPSSNYPPSL